MKPVPRSLKVLVVWELGAHLGHLLRLQPVVTQLRCRGHEVLLAVPDPAAAQDLLRDPQLEFVKCPTLPTRPGTEPLENDVVCYADILGRYAFGEEQGLADAMILWAALIEQCRPDVLLIEFAPLALLAARLHRLPAVHLAIGWELPPAGRTLPVISSGRTPDEASIRNIEASLVKRINRHCWEAGVRQLQWLSDLYESATQLIATLPETDHFGPRSEGRYVGPLFATEFGPEVRWPERSAQPIAKRVFVYLQPDKANLLLFKALKTLGADVIAVLPGLQAAAAERFNNGYVQLYSYPVRLTGLLEQADIAITNAGHGLVAASLLAGTPLLLIPRNVEQAILAERIIRTGAAHVFPRERATTRSHEAIERLMNDAAVHESAKTIARKYVCCTQGSVIARVINALETAVPKHAQNGIEKVEKSICKTPEVANDFAALWSFESGETGLKKGNAA